MGLNLSIILLKAIQMRKVAFLLLFLLPAMLIAQPKSASLPGIKEYLKPIKEELIKEWPNNRTVNLVFHGHSVPSGYFKTPVVNTMDAYPYQVLRLLKEKYPYAVINVINTAIGGENAQSGQKRFETDVLCHKPDVLFIDYALNDRGLGLDAAKTAWEKMIVQAQKKGIKIILLTPSPDLSVDLLDPNTDLEQHSKQIRSLANKYQLGLIDSYAQFRDIKAAGGNIEDYMSQINHPNANGHAVIAKEILKYFID